MMEKMVSMPICHCGCENLKHERDKRICPCGCAQAVESEIEETIKGDYYNCSEPCEVCACESSSGRSSVIRLGMDKITNGKPHNAGVYNSAEVINERPETLKCPTLPSDIVKSSTAAKMNRKLKPINFRVIREICSYLLVSWNAPDLRGNVGYEIRINRNIVAARVRSPTRTEALLGPLDLSGASTDFPGLMILTLYGVDNVGKYSELANIKVQICNKP